MANPRTHWLEMEILQILLELFRPLLGISLVYRDGCGDHAASDSMPATAAAHQTAALGEAVEAKKKKKTSNG